jgi:hypothetical protein
MRSLLAGGCDMTAMPLLHGEGGALGDPVTEIMSRIERVRSRLRRERCTRPFPPGRDAVYPLFDEARLLGSIHSPSGTPHFGPGAAAVLLKRET